MTTTLTEFLQSPGYAIYQVPDYMMEVEKDIDNSMYVRMTFINNKPSFWTMLKKHAERCFGAGEVRTFGSENDWQEVTYVNEFGNDYEVLLSNDPVSNSISVQSRMPYTEASAMRFVEWHPSEACCIDELKQIIHAGAVDLSVQDVYESGTLLGEY